MLQKLDNITPFFFIFDKDGSKTPIINTLNIVKEEYLKLISSLTDKDYFIGGLPISLEKTDLFTLTTKNLDNKYNYTITQKVDGTRLLMCILTIPIIRQGKIIIFIDRNNDIYIAKNISLETLPYVSNLPNMIIDGEMIFIDSDNKLVSMQEKNKQFIFMAFDILIGPRDINYSRDPSMISYEKRLVIEDQVNMIGPKAPNYWTYENRYSVLYKLIYPCELNNNNAILTNIFRDLSWFNLEIKQLFVMDDIKKFIINQNSKLKKDRKELYIDYFQSSLNKFRSEYYNKINKINALNIVPLDGLIFTPYYTKYIPGTWKKYLNIQYKWKPINEQTIDLRILKDGLKIVVANEEEYLMKTKTEKFNLIDIIDSKNELFDSKKKLKEKYVGKICEFTLMKQQIDISSNKYLLKLVFKQIRVDKTTPNSLSTFRNIKNIVINPFEISDLSKLLLNNSTENLKYMKKSQLLQCCLKNNVKIFTDIERQNIQKLLNDKKDNELEIRIGDIMPKEFQTRISFYMYKYIIDFLSKSYQYSYDTFIDYYFANFRQRNKVTQMGLIPLQTIKKEKISAVDISLKNSLNMDVRFSLSKEIEVNEEISKTKLIQIKERFSFNFNNFRVDCTEIYDGKINDGIIEKNSAPSYSIEIEILEKINIYEIENLLILFFANNS